GDQRRHYPPVKLPPRSLQERLVRRLLHERVLEGVGRTRRLPAREEDLRLHEPPELVAQRRLSHPHDRRQQGVRELPSQHGRAVPTRRIRAVGLCSITRPSSSSEEGSHQWRSSTKSTSG